MSENIHARNAALSAFLVFSTAITQALKNGQKFSFEEWLEEDGSVSIKLNVAAHKDPALAYEIV